LGFDIYEGFGVVWLAANLAAGAVAIPLVLWAGRRFGNRGSNLWKRLADDVAGRNLNAAIRNLDEIATFEKD
jgi:hypothetical protein